LIFNTIASATDYYISSSGNDSNNGLSSSTPWKTITKVNSSFSTLKPGDRILFKKGDTFYGTLIITASGSAANPITIGAYGTGNNPIITGFTTISGWTNEGSGIYSSPFVPVGYDSYPMVNMVTLNDTVKAMGRWPDKGYLNYESHTNSPTQSITDNQLTGSPNWTGGEVVIRKYRWILDRQDITNHTNTVITFNALQHYGNNSAYNPIDKNGYFIQGHLNTLNRLGEWYWDKSKNKLYMYFGAANPVSYVVKASQYDRNIHIQNRQYVDFENLDCEGGNTQGIYLNTTDHIKFTNCNLKYQGGNGYYSIYGTYVTLLGGSITNALNDGLSFENGNYNCIIDGVSITNAGMIPGAARSGDGAAVGMFVYGGNNTIRNCSIVNTGFNGIQFGGSNILIENNYVNNFCKVKDDGGGIYTGPGASADINRKIQNNIVVNSKGAYPGCEAYASYEAFGKACGIYMDENSQNVEISGNTVANCSWAGIFIHLARNIQINNNTVYNNDIGQLYFEYSKTGEVINIISSGNKFISKAANQSTYYHHAFVNENPNVTGTFNNNYYARPIDNNATIHVMLSVTGGNDKWYTLAGWQTYTGEDASSHKSNVSTADTTGFFKFVYNQSISNKTMMLNAPMIDVVGMKYTGSITLLPYTSAVLMLDPNPNVAANPLYVSSAVANPTPSILEMTYNMTLANIVPAAASFSVLVNSVARTVSSVAISGTKVLLTLASPIIYGNVVTVSYTKPSSNLLQTTSGGQAVTISAQPVVNNCINVAPTVVITSPINNSSFTALANITVTANALDTDGSISLVEFYNGNVKLGSISTAPYSFTWNNVAAGTYSLTVIATDNLNAKTISSAISISVINSATTVNQPPVVEISNPLKGNKYETISTITLEAIASDPDGSISKVEFYSGSVKLIELTSAPYTYTWKDVSAGTYSITAVATDNLNATATSLPIEFSIGTTIKYDANSEIIKLYPNPNDGHFSIEFINPLQNEKNELVITDLAGKQVYNGPVSKEETIKQIDLSYVKSGIYILMILYKGIFVTKKIIIN
jgi:uncharacterized repeat protein (TIGR02059 family)